MATPEPTLAGLEVLVTRPAERADTLVEAIRAAGGRARHRPLLEIVALDRGTDADIWRQTDEKLRALDRYQRVIAASVSAVHYGLAWIGRHWPLLPPLRWYAIGTATAAALAERGVAATAVTGSMTSEELLALPELQRLAGERALLLRGVGGRELMAETLRARGAAVDYAECYRRRNPALGDNERAALWQPAADVVCVNSGETLANLWHHLPEPGRRLYRQRPLLVPSERVAEQARGLGCERVLVAANAGTEATLAALRELAAQQVGHGAHAGSQSGSTRIPHSD